MKPNTEIIGLSLIILAMLGVVLYFVISIIEVFL